MLEMLPFLLMFSYIMLKAHRPPAGGGFTALLTALQQRQVPLGGPAEEWCLDKHRHMHIQWNHKHYRLVLYLHDEKETQSSVYRMRHDTEQMNAGVIVLSGGLLFPSSGRMGRACSSTASSEHLIFSPTGLELLDFGRSPCRLSTTYYLY